eukprot:scaffold7500_cov127-Isochrysis_galbana.AAC.9
MGAAPLLKWPAAQRVGPNTTCSSTFAPWCSPDESAYAQLYAMAARSALPALRSRHGACMSAEHIRPLFWQATRITSRRTWPPSRQMRALASMTRRRCAPHGSRIQQGQTFVRD